VCCCSTLTLCCRLPAATSCASHDVRRFALCAVLWEPCAHVCVLPCASVLVSGFAGIFKMYSPKELEVS
jgi:hypothetical protein